MKADPYLLSAKERQVFTAYKKLKTGQDAIFIHIPKTAGTSIRQTLGIPQPNHSKRHFRKHYTLAQVEVFLGRECLDQAFIFAVVRNPWERLYSAYLFRKRKVLEGKVPRITSLEQANLDDFGSWVRLLDQRKHPTRGVLTRPQMSWIKNSRGEVQVSLLARYESLAEDYKKICTELSIPFVPLKKINISKKKKDYRDVHDDFTRAFVEEHYQEDIEALGYEFNSPPRQD